VFTDLAHHTKSDYQRIFDYLRPIADTALARFDAPLVVRIRIRQPKAVSAASATT
jgi:hypothetical protein